MNPPLLRILGAAVLSVLATALVWAGCRASSEAHLRGAQSGLPLPTDEDTSRDESCAARLQVLRWCEETRRALVAELAAGRRTLLQTAAGFRAVDDVKGRFVPVVSFAFLGRTEEEQLCRRVILFARDLRRQQPDPEGLVARLEAELAELMGRDRPLELPEFRRPPHIPWYEP
jgi:hypothetical protein